MTFRLRPLSSEPRSPLLRLPFGMAPNLIKRRVRRAIAELLSPSEEALDLFLLRRYAEDVAVLDQIERRARALARASRRQTTGRAINSWIVFSCTPAGRRIHAAKDALLDRIESEEAALCG